MKPLLISVFFLCASLSSSAFAAPSPGTATSKLVSPQLGLYHSPLGFQLTGGSSGWAHVAPPQTSKYIVTAYRAEPGSVADQIHSDLRSQGNVVNGGKTPQATAKALSAASLTVRVDNLEKETTLDHYIGKWMKEYPRYGFDVLGSKPFMQGKNKGYVLDLVNRNQGKQLRQVVFLKQKNAVILTCRDRLATFQTSLKACNQIIKTFTW